MPGLTIGWEYLTGKYVATDPTSRERAEWPPHPGRVFMALAAAWFETGEDPVQGEALRWLERLGDPQLIIPVFHSHRSVVDVYVPVNDVPGPSKAIVQSAPGFTRDRKDRTFPSVWIGETPVWLSWPDAKKEDIGRYKAALEQLCNEVTRIGHSSSLVRMWIAEDGVSHLQQETWIPDDSLPELQTRRVSQGTLDLLDRQFNRRGREAHERLTTTIETLAMNKKSIRGKGGKEQKAAIDREMEECREQVRAIDARDPIRPKLALWTGYRRKESAADTSVSHTEFDSDVLILTQTAGRRLPLTTTIAVTQAIRGTLMSHLGTDIPEWVSGHKFNGEPLRKGNEQMAFIPLAHVGHEHSDGHLLGLGIVFPHLIKRSERGRVLGGLLLNDTGEPKEIELRLGRIGEIKLQKRDWNERRIALLPETWTAHPQGATTWASVTPVVLDRFPKCDPVKEREAWCEEICGIIKIACQRLGLPDPAEIDFGTTSRLRGCPRSTMKRRPLRGQPNSPTMTVPFGDGFPAYPTKNGNGARPQFHVFLRFDAPVVGPILLCAGRFLGYGLFKPVTGGANR